VELCSALWVLILGVSHVSEMVRESKCISHLQINQISVISDHDGNIQCKQYKYTVVAHFLLIRLHEIT